MSEITMSMFIITITITLPFTVYEQVNTIITRFPLTETSSFHVYTHKSIERDSDGLIRLAMLFPHYRSRVHISQIRNVVGDLAV